MFLHHVGAGRYPHTLEKSSFSSPIGTEEEPCTNSRPSLANCASDLDS